MLKVGGAEGVTVGVNVVVTVLFPANQKLHDPSPEQLPPLQPENV